MNPLKTHLIKNGRSACGNIVQTKYMHISEIFIYSVNRCKKCDLILNLDLDLEK